MPRVAPTPTEGALLWSPPPDVLDRCRLGAFWREAEHASGARFDDYDALWRWSVEELEAFWRLVWEHFEVRAEGDPARVCTTRAMPGAHWFPDVRLNYAEHALRRNDDTLAVLARSDTHPGADTALTFGELRDRVARAAEGLRRLGVGPGDRVAAYLPNVPETLVAFLASASLGAVWSSCAPEFGTRAVVDRLRQIEPKVLFVVDGYRYGAKDVDRGRQVAEIRESLPGLAATVLLPYLEPGSAGRRVPDALPWEKLCRAEAPLRFERVPFEQPLYILYSSGTTGAPKAIVHGHGGILLEHLKVLALHHDLGPGDRFFWFTTTGWMMWNYLVSGLLVGSTLVLYDGDPGHPDLRTLWRLAAEKDVTCFGVSAPFLLNCRKADLEPGREFDLASIRSIGSTGAPLPPEGFRWVYDSVGRDLVLGSVSGGTDVCTAFVGPAPVLPVRTGEIACRYLGAKVEAFDAEGRSVVGERGELVVTEPLPSMPVALWGDRDGSRLRATYFERFPGVWSHGDWIRITERGSCVITGRSDATLNRGGVRMGTSEFYSAVEGLPEVRDSLVVHVEDPAGGAGELLLFVALTPEAECGDALRARVARSLREQVSPRHVPDALFEVPEVPRTLSGKKLEVPVKRLFAGASLEEVASRDALVNPDALETFARIARERAARDSA